MKIRNKTSNREHTKFQKTKFHYIKSVLIIFSLLPVIKASAPNAEVVFTYASTPVFPDETSYIDPFEKLINAIIKVESSGDTLAFNLNEGATGALQIRPIRLKDYNQRTGNNYKIEDCYNIEISKEIFLYYAERTGSRNYELIARRWNGSGKATLDYWEKVKLHL